MILFLHLMFFKYMTIKIDNLLQNFVIMLQYGIVLIYPIFIGHQS